MFIFLYEMSTLLYADKNISIVNLTIILIFLSEYNKRYRGVAVSWCQQYLTNGESKLKYSVGFRMVKKYKTHYQKSYRHYTKAV